MSRALGLICTSVILLFLVGTVQAIPGVPHRFFGDALSVSSTPVPDGLLITAFADDEQVASILTSGGQYGYDSVFFIADPDNDMKGEMILFFINGVPAGEAIFMNSNSTLLNIMASNYICGDGICDSGESCSSCPGDCGECSGNGGSPPGGGPPPCVSNWTCTEWSECVNSTQTRECVDIKCGRTSASNKPAEVQNCTVTPLTPTGTCVSGLAVCAGEDLYECQNQEWEMIETCQYGCNDTVVGEAVCNTETGENGEDEDEGNGGPPTGWFLEPASLFAIFIVVAVILVGGVVWKVKRK